MTRLRGIIQDRLVHPNHLTLSLPRLQTSSPSMPIVADLGQRAVEAVREGISKAASDFVNLGQEDHLPDDPDQQSLSQPQSHLPSPPASPILGRKRIPMPAGFPGYSQAAMESPALTPTPGAGPSNGDSRRAAPPPPPSFGQSQRPQSTAHSSSYRTPGLAATGRTSSVAPAMVNTNGVGNGHGSNPNSNSQFRFRGQFASQPPTPGGNPRVGALNSRAPSTQL
jgi:maintenance of morphology protein 1